MDVYLGKPLVPAYFFTTPPYMIKRKRAVNCSSENGLKGKEREMALAKSSGKTCGGREGGLSSGSSGVGTKPSSSKCRRGTQEHLDPRKENTGVSQERQYLPIPGRNLGILRAAV